MKRLFICFSFAVLAAFNAKAQSAQMLQSIADYGMQSAQAQLGVKYYKGDGVPQDYKQAVYWLERAARQGVYEAMGWLGICYYNGYGVEKDLWKATYWLDIGANNVPHDVYAAHNLGICYIEYAEKYTGEDRKKYAEQALWWLYHSIEGEYRITNEEEVAKTKEDIKNLENAGYRRAAVKWVATSFTPMQETEQESLVYTPINYGQGVEYAVIEEGVGSPVGNALLPISYNVKNSDGKVVGTSSRVYFGAGYAPLWLEVAKRVMRRGGKYMLKVPANVYIPSGYNRPSPNDPPYYIQCEIHEK